MTTLTATTTSRAGCIAGRIAHILTRPWLQIMGVVVALAVSLWSFDRVPDASWQPAVIALVPWAIGKYLLCPLRWHALSVSGRTRRWHLRIYAESELLGLASPGHVGADLWRMHRLQTGAGMARPCAVAEVALDRLVGALGLTIFVLVSGVTLPPQLLLAAVGIALGVFVIALLVRRRRPDLLAGRPMPRPRVVIKGALLSMGYQLTIMGLLIGTVAAMGEQLQPLALLGVFGASQVAGIVPGVNGASAREGALVVGLASLGISWPAAVGAVALMALLAWVPAMLLGGGSFVVRRLAALRTVQA
ncbi:MAG: hypothetical protein QOH75_1441 [Actinomycetota bacterium]|nr:hypothetical protein [Actinomycetota bacterium]